MLNINVVRGRTMNELSSGIGYQSSQSFPVIILRTDLETKNRLTCVRNFSSNYLTAITDIASYWNIGSNHSILRRGSTIGTVAGSAIPVIKSGSAISGRRTCKVNHHKTHAQAGKTNG